MKTGLALLFVSFSGFFMARATFQELAAQPAEYIRSNGVFREGIAVCIDTATHPARILATHQPSRPGTQPKLVLVKTRAETVRSAGIRPGTIFTAEGIVDGRPLNGQQEFWIEAKSLQATGRTAEYHSYPVSCDELFAETRAEKRKVPWPLAVMASTFAFGSGMILGEILTNNPSSPF